MRKERFGTRGDSHPLLIEFVKGLPASGKSTYALNLVKANSRWKRVNKDDLRYMVHDEDFGKFDRKKEDLIVAAQSGLIRFFLSEGFNVIVDDTNLAGKHWERVCDIAKEAAEAFGCTVEVKEVFIDVPLEECLRRNALRSGPRKVPDKVIRDMARHLKHDSKRERPYRPFVEGLPFCVVTDVDGTVALLNGRNPYDTAACGGDLPNPPVMDVLLTYQTAHPVVVVSGREEKFRAETEEWLTRQGVKFAALFMRVTGDKRGDDVVKTEIYERDIFPRWNVKFVLDDRNRVVDAIRDLGVPVFQVAPGDF